MPPDIKEDGDTELPSTSSSEKSSSDLEEKTQGKDKTDFITKVGMTLFVILFLGGGILKGIWSDPDGKAFLTRWWAVIGAVIGLIVAVILLICIRIWFKHTTAERRTGAVVFVVLPLLLIAIGTIVLLQQAYQITVVRSVFLAAVCLFPALLYYLFIGARKFSLLNDYFVNLSRLGLLRDRFWLLDSKTAHIERNIRLRNYIQKFEALYGPVPNTLREAIVDSGDPLSVLAEPASAKWFGKPLWDSGSSGSLPVFTAETAIPVVLATVLIAIGWVIALPPTGRWEDISSAFWSTAFGLNEGPIIYAFLGAYFFALQMLFRRYVRDDLRQSAYLAVSLRIVLAIIGTWVAVKAIAATGRKVPDNAKSLLVVGFVIGVFPRIAWQFIQGAWKFLMKKLHLSAVLPSMESGLPVSDLDGLTVWHEARLEEEDIENIPNMATTEIVDLMLRTRFPPDRIIDWVDQAILFTHLGPDQEGEKKGQRKDLLRLYGIRTATSLIQAFRAADNREDAKQVEQILSKALRSDVRLFLDAIQTEPNLELICAWRGMGKERAHIVSERVGSAGKSSSPR